MTVVDLAQGERHVEALASEIGQSIANTSHHLQVLAAAGLVTNRRDGNRIYYELASQAHPRGSLDPPSINSPNSLVTCPPPPQSSPTAEANIAFSPTKPSGCCTDIAATPAGSRTDIRNGELPSIPSRQESLHDRAEGSD